LNRIPLVTLTLLLLLIPLTAIAQPPTFRAIITDFHIAGPQDFIDGKRVIFAGCKYLYSYTLLLDPRFRGTMVIATPLRDATIVVLLKERVIVSKSSLTVSLDMEKELLVIILGYAPHMNKYRIKFSLVNVKLNLGGVWIEPKICYVSEYIKCLAEVVLTHEKYERAERLISKSETVLSSIHELLKMASMPTIAGVEEVKKFLRLSKEALESGNLDLALKYSETAFSTISSLETYIIRDREREVKRILESKLDIISPRARKIVSAAMLFERALHEEDTTRKLKLFLEAKDCLHESEFLSDEVIFTNPLLLVLIMISICELAIIIYLLKFRDRDKRSKAEIRRRRRRSL